jgi:hypothetical protein
MNDALMIRLPQPKAGYKWIFNMDEQGRKIFVEVKGKFTIKDYLSCIKANRGHLFNVSRSKHA